MESHSGVTFSLVEYFNYMKGNNHSRCVSEGEEVLDAGHIILCGITDTSDNKMCLYALCLQTSALQAHPHTIKGTFSINDNTKALVNNFECTCKAGQSGQCKHISAVLIKCTRSPLNKLERISQTDAKCVWSTQKKSTQELYKPVPIKEMPCFRGLPSISYELDEIVSSQIEKDIIEFLPNSAFSLHTAGRRMLPHDEAIMSDQDVDNRTFEIQSLTLIFNNSCQSPIMMEISHSNVDFSRECCKHVLQSFEIDDHEQLAFETKLSLKDWHKARQYRITGSRIYEIFTYCGTNWKNKAAKYFWPKHFSNKYTRYGLEQEPNARRKFIEYTSLNVIETGIIIAPNNEWLGYSPDGIVVSNGIPVGLLEIKCPFAGKCQNLDDVLKTLTYLKIEEGVYALKEKHKYYGQVQLGMAILNIEICYFVIYCSHNENMVIIKVPFDYTFSKKMLIKVKENFIKNMIHEICENK